VLRTGTAGPAGLRWSARPGSTGLDP
jgi:hypothetical protein